MDFLMLIGICGLISAGKSTTANYLTQFKEFEQFSFASPLKDATAAVFGWDRSIIEGDTPESRAAREELDPFWTEKLGRPWSMRIALQQLGTEVFRNNVSKDIWMLSAEKKIRDNFHKNIVIADARFPNEINMIQSFGGKMWRIKRGPDPEWFSYAQKVLRRNTYEEAVILMKDQYPDVHPSEFSWVATEFDIVLDNNNKIPYLYKSIEDALNV